MSKDSLVTLAVVIIIVIGIVALLSKKPAATPSFPSDSSSATAQPSAALGPSSSPITNSTSPAMSQLKIEDLKVGTGSAVKSGDTIEINYLGTLENGQKFDSSYDRGQAFETQIGVGRVIKGWDEGVLGMKVGGKRRLTIPSELGYGSQGAGGVIPPNATLIFEVELVAIK